MNLLCIVPLIFLVYGLVALIPTIITYIDSLNIAVLDCNPSYKKLTFVVLSPPREGAFQGKIFIFKRRRFNEIRRYIFTDPKDPSSQRILERDALGFSPIFIYNEPLEIVDSSGDHITTVLVDRVRGGTIEVMFYKNRVLQTNKQVLYAIVLFFIGLITLGGMLGGVADFTQRMVYHETRKISYLFYAIKQHFFRSLIITLFFFIIIAAVASNIYFYIFVVSSDVSVFIAALNIWMLFFFLFILLWIYPLTVINRDDVIWRVMKKSLFLAFDNFEYTFDMLILTLVFCIVSIVTGGVLPGITGIFSFLNNALKDISSRYSREDTA